MELKLDGMSLSLFPNFLLIAPLMELKSYNVIHRLVQTIF